ncbi:MAG: hypothetical protein VSS75_029675, partial [Candidatus Parabeggiatoa sp.]|nr:hypothetical protein [Candidatus Parabeggiatoa sp.]
MPRVSMARVFVSTFAKKFQVRKSNPLRGPFAVKYPFIRDAKHRVSTIRVFVSTFAKNFPVRRSNPLRGPFAVKYLFIIDAKHRVSTIPKRSYAERSFVVLYNSFIHVIR